MNTEYVIAAIECLIDAKVNGTEKGVRQAQKELRRAFREKAFGEGDLYIDVDQLAAKLLLRGGELA